MDFFLSYNEFIYNAMINKLNLDCITANQLNATTHGLQHLFTQKSLIESIKEINSVEMLFWLDLNLLKVRPSRYMEPVLLYKSESAK